MDVLGVYAVTAHALNLRGAPDTTALILGVMREGSLVSRLRDNTGAPGDWLRVVWNGTEGYAAAKFLRAQDGVAARDGVAPQNAAGPRAAPVAASAASVEARDRDITKLHPQVRAGVGALLKTLAQDNIPFRVFEAFRTPDRQAYLYAQGRTRGGSIVTKAPPWRSLHQYGLAVDLVLFDGGGWSWDSSGNKRDMWKRMHEVARANGLEPLQFELPHVQLAGLQVDDLLKGVLPGDGDDTWYDCLCDSSGGWAGAGSHPAGPRIARVERPALPQEDPLATV